MSHLSKKSGFNAFAKSIDQGQPNQFAHEYLYRNILLLINFLHGQGPGSIFINPSLEHYLSYFPDFFSIFRNIECNTSSDWLNHTV